MQYNTIRYIDFDCYVENDLIVDVTNLEEFMNKKNNLVSLYLSSSANECVNDHSYLAHFISFYTTHIRSSPVEMEVVWDQGSL